MQEELIAYRLDQLKEDQKAMIENFNEFKKEVSSKLEHLTEEIVTLKTRSSIWGAVAGAIATGLIYVISRLLGSKL